MLHQLRSLYMVHLNFLWYVLLSNVLLISVPHTAISTLLKPRAYATRPKGQYGQFSQYQRIGELAINICLFGLISVGLSHRGWGRGLLDFKKNFFLLPPPQTVSFLDKKVGHGAGLLNILQNSFPSNGKEDSFPYVKTENQSSLILACNRFLSPIIIIRKWLQRMPVVAFIKFSTNVEQFLFSTLLSERKKLQHNALVHNKIY